jgi:hypothetical protein
MGGRLPNMIRSSVAFKRFALSPSLLSKGSLNSYNTKFDVESHASFI